MASVLADHMDAARRRHFVGREDEQRVFEAALSAAELPFHVLHIQGPPGIGKSTLLQLFRHLCRKEKVPAHYVDARDFEAQPERVYEALRRRTGLDFRKELEVKQRTVLMIDSFDELTSLDRWFREEFLPRLPADMLLVLSSLDRLPLSWQADGGLQPLLRTLSLRNLRPEDACRFLEKRSVAEEHHASILHFAHGHPMALSLIADAFDQHPERSFEPLDSPDLVGVLLKRFIDEVPSSTHRTALESAALVRATTEPLLVHMLQDEDVRSVFEWLRSLSFMETTRDGLVPHEVAREVITADLRWRNRERYDELHRRVRRYYAAQIQEGPFDDPTHLLTDYLFLYRDHPIFEPHFRSLSAQWKHRDDIRRTSVEEEDWPALRAMVLRHEGEKSAEHFDWWKEQRPDTVEVYRNKEGEPVGFTLNLPLEELSEEEAEADPITQATMQYLEEHAPLRADERATLFRFWMDAEQHQQVSPVQSLISAYRIQDIMKTPRLAYTLAPYAYPENWELIMAYADMQRLSAIDFELNGIPFGMFGHDWRATPPAAWIDLVADREVSSHRPQDVPPSPSSTVLVLSKPAFEDAVKCALQDYARPDGLIENPLLRSRLVMEAGDGTDAAPEAHADTLRTLLREAAERLQSAPREAKFYRAVEATYLDPAPTQERAAELLELPFSTFRRHLRKGVEHITEALWQQETGAHQS